VNIDVHGHIVVEEILRSDAHDESWRPEITRQADGQQMMRVGAKNEGPIPKEVTDWPTVIENLDATAVDVMAVSPAPPCFLYHLDGKTGLMTSQIQNDAIAAAVATYPTRLVGLGTLPMQDLDLAVKELDRVVNELKMPGVEIATNIDGVYLGDDSLRPFWAAVNDLDTFVFVHPFNPLGMDRYGVYHLVNLVGFVSDTARSIADVAFSGLLDEFPGLKMCFSHGGGTAHRDQGQDRQAAERVCERPVLRQHHALGSRSAVPRRHGGRRSHHDRVGLSLRHGSGRAGEVR
jgi:aminocarboxymuconate-semialdehyde decarboxylase